MRKTNQLKDDLEIKSILLRVANSELKRQDMKLADADVKIVALEDEFWNLGDAVMAEVPESFRGWLGVVRKEMISELIFGSKPKTYLEDLLEKYPNTPLNIRKVPKYACPINVGLSNITDCDEISGNEKCVRCWNQRMEESK